MTPEITHKSVLDNGIRVLTHQMPGSHATSIGILVECGTRDETAGEHGLAHLTEHILFQGTERRTGLEIAREIDAVGGQVGAFTSRDYTCYSASIASDYTFQALDLLADIIQYPSCPAEDIEIEKRVILREMEMIQDTPARRALEQLQAGVWGEHALGRPVIGQPKALQHLNRDSIVSFLARFYRPSRIIVAAAGEVSHSHFVSQVNDCFWRLGGSSPSRSPDPGLWRETTARTPASSRQSYFCVGLPAVPYEHPARYVFHLLDRIVGGGMSSRLYRRLRDELGLVYDIRSEYLAYRDGGMWLVEGTTAPEFESQAVAAVLEQLEDLADHPVEEDELWIAKKKLHCNLVLGCQDPHTVMSRGATQETYFGKTIPLDSVRHSVDRVGQEQITSVVQQYLYGSLREAGVVCLGPDGTAAEGVFAETIERFRKRQPRRLN